MLINFPLRALSRVYIASTSKLLHRSPSRLLPVFIVPRNITEMAQEFVDTQIKDNKVVMFSKSYCPFCRMAKTALDQAGAKYATFELDERGDGDAIQDYLKTLTGGRSVPRVFIGQKFVGGGTEVKALHDTGKLAPLLKDAGAL